MPLDKDKLTESLVAVFSDLNVNATSKDKFIQIFEAIVEYSRGVVPPSATVDAFGQTILRVLSKFPGGAFSAGIPILEKQLPRFAQGVAIGMLPLYKGTKPPQPLDTVLQKVMAQNVAEARSMEDCAKAMADAIHQWFSTGTAEATPIAFGVPPFIPSWGIASIQREDYNKGDYSGIKWLPIDSIGHPNANRVRRVLRALEYGEKGKRRTGRPVGEMSNGGDISNLMANWLIFALSEIKQEMPEVSLAMTGGNDIFHHDLGYTSNHTRGHSMDFVVLPAGGNIPKVADILHGISGSPSNVRADGEPIFRFIDEYNHPSAEASAAHFHLSVHPDPPDSRESISRAAKSRRLVDSGRVPDRPFDSAVYIFEESTQSLIIEQNIV